MLKRFFGRSTRPALTGTQDAPASTPERTRIYAVGDIHGRPDLLDRLHDKILADAETCDADRRVIVYLGDYVDRGPGSYDIVETLARRPLPGFQSVHLKGNHEAMFLDFLDGRDEGDLWLRNGGDATLTSYGAAGSNGLAAQPSEIRSQLRLQIPDHHLEFFHSLPHMHKEGGYLFAHAGIRPGLSLADQDPHDLIWIRGEFLDSDDDHGFVVVHGHSPARQVLVRQNRIGIDTGAFATGVLTAVVLEGSSLWFLQTSRG